MASRSGPDVLVVAAMNLDKITAGHGRSRQVTAGRGRSRHICSNKSVYLKKRPAGQLASEDSEQAQRGRVRTDSEGTRGHDVGGEAAPEESCGHGHHGRSRQVAAGHGRSRH